MTPKDVRTALDDIQMVDKILIDHGHEIPAFASMMKETPAPQREAMRSLLAVGLWAFLSTSHGDVMTIEKRIPAAVLDIRDVKAKFAKDGNTFTNEQCLQIWATLGMLEALERIGRAIEDIAYQLEGRD